jgi:hypothetical protein
MDFRGREQERIRAVTNAVHVLPVVKGEFSIGTKLLAPLIPFKSVMVRQLNRRGFNTSQLDLKRLTALYYNEIVSNKENKENHFVPISYYEFCNNVAFKIRPSDNLNGDISDFKNLENFDHVNSVTNNIIASFKKAKAKKLKAHYDGLSPRSALTDDEFIQAKALERIENSLEEKALNIKPVSLGDFKNLFLLFLGVWLLIYIFE